MAVAEKLLAVGRWTASRGELNRRGDETIGDRTADGVVHTWDPDSGEETSLWQDGKALCPVKHGGSDVTFG